MRVRYFKEINSSHYNSLPLQQYFFHGYAYDYKISIAFCKYLSKTRFKTTQVPNETNPLI